MKPRWQEHVIPEEEEHFKEKVTAEKKAKEEFAKNKKEELEAAHKETKPEKKSSENKTIDPSEKLISAKLKFKYERLKAEELSRTNLTKAAKVEKVIADLEKKPAHKKSAHDVSLLNRAKFERELAQKDLTSRYETANAEVRVRNIFVHQKPVRNDLPPVGEFNLALIETLQPYERINRESDESLVIRIFNHIQFMAEKANTIHLAENFYPPEKERKNIPLAPALMKPNKKNEITRLSFPEFSFYPFKDRGPLSINSFKLLQQKIEDLAKNYPLNLHLLLGTFAVKDNQNEVFNIAVHVQCGDPPKITLFAKDSPTYLDPAYPKLKNPSKNPLQKTERFISGIQANYSRTPECTTAGGAKFITAIDICIDNHWQAAADTLDQEITTKEGQDVLPNTVSHVVTSNSIDPVESSFSNRIEQVDPYHSRLYNQQQKKSIHSVKREEVVTTYFGGKARIFYYPPTSLNKLSGDIGEKVNLNNEIVEELKKLKRLRLRYPKLKEVYNRSIFLHILDAAEQAIWQFRLLESSNLLELISETANKILTEKKINIEAIYKIIRTFEPYLKTKTSPIHKVATFITSLLEIEMHEQKIESKEEKLEAKTSKEKNEDALFQENKQKLHDLCTHINDLKNLRINQEGARSDAISALHIKALNIHTQFQNSSHFYYANKLYESFNMLAVFSDDLARIKKHYAEHNIQIPQHVNQFEENLNAAFGNFAKTFSYTEKELFKQRNIELSRVERLVREKTQFKELVHAYQNEIKLYLENKSPHSSRKASIEEINALIKKFPENNYSENQLNILLGCLIDASKKATLHQQNKFFRRSEVSEFSTRMNRVVDDFLLKNNLHLNKNNLEDAYLDFKTPVDSSPLRKKIG